MSRWFKTLFEKKPPAEFQHAELGSLVCDEGLWSGSAQRDGRHIPFVVAGTEAAPDPVLLDRLLSILTRFREFETCARHFLCPPGVPVKPEDFTFQSVDLLTRPDCCTFEFALEGDAGAIWRVEFENEQPKYTGRDD